MTDKISKMIKIVFAISIFRRQ